MTATHPETAPADGLTADFYGYENLLSDEERKLLRTARDFMRAEVKPLVNSAWAKGSSPAN